MAGPIRCVYPCFMRAEGARGAAGDPLLVPDDLLQRLVESISAVTYVFRFGHVDEAPIFVSPQCERVLGLPRTALMVDARGRNDLLHPDDRERIWKRATQIDATGGDWDEEYRLVLPDGSLRWVHDQARVAPEVADRPALWFGVLTDLTRANEAERALADSEARYRALVEQIPAVTYIDTCEERPVTLYVSPQTTRITGYRPEEWIADPTLWLRVVHPDDRHLMKEDWPQHLEHPDELTQEFRLIHRDGHVVWMRDAAKLIRAEDGTPLFWQGIALDITDHMLAQEQLRDSEARYRALIEEIPAYVYIATDDPEPVMTFVSPQTLEMIGYPAHAWMSDGDLWLKATHPDDRASVKAAWESAVERRATFVSEYRAIRRDGREIWLRDVARLVQEADGERFFWQGLVQDITERKRAEDEIRGSEVRYRALVEQVPAVVFIDTNEVSPICTYVSPQSLDVLGHPPEAYMEDPFLLFGQIHADDVERVREAWAEAVRHQESFLCDYRLLRPDGRLVMIRQAAVQIRSGDDTPPYWQGLIQDLTDLKHAEEGLRASEARFRALVERSPAVVYEVDLDDERRTLYVSPQVEFLFGYSRQEWLDQPDIWTELLHPDDREIELAAHDRHNETGAPWRQEYRLIASDGRVVWVRDQAELIRDESGRGSTWQGIMLDITALKELEEQLRLSNDELELRVIERTAELGEANEMMTLEIGERLRVEAELRATQERYRRLVEDIPAVVYMWRLSAADGEGAENYTSPQIERLLGFTVEEWNDTDLWRQRLHPHDRERIFAAAARRAATGAPYAVEYRLLAKDGHVVWVADHSTLLSRDPQGKPLLFQGVLLDITARKEAEALEEQFRELIDSNPVVSWVFESTPDEDSPVRFLHVSQQISELIGQSVDNLLSDYGLWIRHIHPDDRQRVLEASLRSRETGRPWQRTFRVIARDGRVVSVLSVGRCVQRDADGTPRRFVGALLDVTASTTERDRIEAERVQLRSLVDGLPGFPWTEVVEGEPGSGRLTFIGARVEEVLGYTAEELLSTPGYFENMIHPDDRRRLDALNVHHDLTEEPWLAEFRVRKRDGRTRWLRSQGLASRDENGRLVWNGITFDITDERADADDVTVIPDTRQIES